MHLSEKVKQDFANSLQRMFSDVRSTVAPVLGKSRRTKPENYATVLGKIHIQVLEDLDVLLSWSLGAAFILSQTLLF